MENNISYYQKNKYKINARKRAWRKKNREILLKKDREYYKKNAERERSYARELYRKNSQKELDRIRYKKYGITGDEFRALVEKQGIKCPICNKDITKNPTVDHDHSTGKIRGLICSPCNLAIGNAEDSPDRLRAMANYLEKSK